MKDPTRRPFLYLVRHGESEGNFLQPSPHEEKGTGRGAFLGHRDAPLTARGRAQAEQLGGFFRTLPPHVMLCSPLKRALQTASSWGIPLVDQRLKEQDYGQWDGLGVQEVQLRFPENYRQWLSGNPNCAPVGGESLQEVSLRLAPLLAELTAFRHGLESCPRPWGDTEHGVVVVAHASVLQTLLCLVLATPLRNRWAYRFQLASVACVDFSFGVPSLLWLTNGPPPFSHG